MKIRDMTKQEIQCQNKMNLLIDEAKELFNDNSNHAFFLTVLALHIEQCREIFEIEFEKLENMKIKGEC